MSVTETSLISFVAKNITKIRAAKPQKNIKKNVYAIVILGSIIH